MKTIKDVAKLAGVSTATVSYVINGSRFVSQPLVMRVNEAVKQLNYRPSGVAKSLKLKKTFTIGVVVSDIRNPFFAAVVTGIRDYCYKYRNRYGLILGDSYENPKRATDNINLLMEKQVDGFVIAPIGTDPEEIDSVRASNVPFVLINRIFPSADDPSVIVDNEEGSYRITKHLLELGHRSVGMICGPKAFYTTQRRLKGYVRAFKELRIPVKKNLISYSKLDINECYKKTCDLLMQHDRPTAIFATNNVLLTGTLWALRERKMRIPQEMSLVAFSFDDTPWPLILDPPLTIMSQPTFRIGWEAAKMLFALMNERPCRSKIVLSPKLIIGNSVSSPA